VHIDREWYQTKFFLNFLLLYVLGNMASPSKYPTLLETVGLRRIGAGQFANIIRPWAPEESIIAGLPADRIEAGRALLFGRTKRKPDGQGSESKRSSGGVQQGGNVYGGHVLAQALWAASLYGKFGIGTVKGVWSVHVRHHSLVTLLMITERSWAFPAAR
jgi:hypothetical protein